MGRADVHGRRPDRRALVHRPPASEPQTAVPLVCMLHGCTQDAASFAAATLMNDAADRHGFVVGLSPAGARRQRPGVLELVPARAPSTRRGRAGVDRRDRPRAHGDGVAVGDRPSPRLRGRPLRGRRHGRHPGGDLSGPLRSRRGALGARVPLRRQRGRRLHRDGARQRGSHRPGARRPCRHGRPRPRRPEHRRARQRGHQGRPGQRRPGAAAVHGRQPPRGARGRRPRYRAPHDHRRAAGSTAATPTRAANGRTAAAS